MNELQISPSHTIDILNSSTPIETKIDILEAQMQGWIFRHADALASNQYKFREDAGFALLLLTSQYFEAIESYYRGKSSKRRSQEFFRGGFLRVFPEIKTEFAPALDPKKLIEDVLNDVYDELRCGLYHDGATRGRIIIRHDTGAMGFVMEMPPAYTVVTITIDPWQILARVQTHFAQFLADLRDPKNTELRANFEKIFDGRAAKRTQVIPPVALPIRATSTF